MNNQETVLTFAQGSLIAKNELVFELSLADQNALPFKLNN